MENYLNTKKVLFDSLNENAVAVINADSEYSRKIVSSCRATVMTYGITSAASIRAGDVHVGLQGFSARIDDQTVRTHLVGRFNVYNFLGAYSTIVGLGVDVQNRENLFSSLSPAPGRFEQLHSPKGWTVIVDYAHTPDALRNCLEAIHDILPVDRTNTIITIFGAGGDRDTTKRPIMGSIAEQLSDVVIITSDNPRTEDPRSIINDILKGIAKKDEVIVQPDRLQAIREGMSKARPGDIILIAGKGHEEYQVIGTTKHHFSDKEEVLKLFDR